MAEETFFSSNWLMKQWEADIFITLFIYRDVKLDNKVKPSVYDLLVTVKRGSHEGGDCSTEVDLYDLNGFWKKVSYVR